MKAGSFPLLLLAVFVGCGDDAEDFDAGSDATVTDVGAPDTAPFDGATNDTGGVCEVPDEVCPETIPVEGGACRTGLECTFPLGRAFPPWTFRCLDAVWAPDPAPCSSVCGGGCAAPALAERCRDPFGGSLPSATLLVGAPAASFAPFEEGEEVMLTVGGQGAAMLELELVVNGGDEIRCGAVTIDLELDGVPAERWTGDVEFQCGSTRRLFYVMPPECPEVPSQGKLTIEVQGVGVFERTLLLRTDIPCTRG